MKKEEMRARAKIYLYLVIGLMAVLLVRLTIIQLFDNEIYQTQAKENHIRLLSIKAPRGEIYLKNGEILATNKLVYTLNLTFTGVKNQDLIIEKLVDLLQDYYPEVGPEFIKEKISLQQNRLFESVILIRDIPWELVVTIEENRQHLPGVAISVEPLRYYPRGSLAGHILGYIHSISPEELAVEEGSGYGINSLIGKSGIEKQYEKELKGSDGARRVEVDARGRPVGEPVLTLETKPGHNIYLTIDEEIQKVLENSMDETLKGLQKRYPKAKVGSAVVLDVKTGEILGMCSSPVMFPDDWKGNISSKRFAYYSGNTGGRYDPNEPGAISNRAIQTTYPPGSTFKMITGIAALDKGVVDPNEFIKCQGRYWIPPNITCWNVHGNVNYYSAMAQSCNTFFQEMGRRAGKEEIIRVAQQFGLGERTGVDIPNEVKGLLPTPEWKREINALLIDRRYEYLQKELDDRYSGLIEQAEDQDKKNRLEKELKNKQADLKAQYNIDYQFNTKWQPYDTFNMSIGQGSNDYTVIQMANYVATIANGGVLRKLHLVSKIVSAEGQTVKEIFPQLIHEADIDPKNIEETQKAMHGVTQPSGTAYFLFHHFPAEIKVAAKTGTAQTGRVGDDINKEFHGVFVAFAPLEDPQIAFAGVVEYGFSGGESAGLICRDVFEHYFGIKNHLPEADADIDRNMSDLMHE